MGKRFGRNQKRAMRAQIKQLSLTAMRNAQQLNQLNEDLAYSNAIVERTSQVLGEHFVTLPLKTKEVEDIVSRFQYSIFQPRGFEAVKPAVMQALDYIDTHQASVHADELRGVVHMRYASISGAVGYGLSDTAWRKLPEHHLRSLLANEIAPEMARLLVKNRKNHNF